MIEQLKHPLQNLAQYQRSAGKQAGFTLLEILIAMSIFAMIAVGATQILTRVTDSNDLSNERFEQLQELQRAMLIMERDFLQMVPRKARINGQTSPLVIAGGEFELGSQDYAFSFVRQGWHNPQMRIKRSTQQGVAYRLVDNQLERLYSNYVDNPIGSEPKTRVILKDIESFKVEILREVGTDKQTWSNNLNSPDLPAAVAIILQSTVYGEIRREFRVAL